MFLFLLVLFICKFYIIYPIVKCALGYWRLCDLTFRLNANAKVSVPILPINIQIIITIFPTIDRLVVIPVESPTVENADTVSNAIGIKPLLPSLILRINIAINMIDVEKRKIEKAL